MAGIKGEKSRCARNCFLCPVCTHTLSVSASDLGGSRNLQEQLDHTQLGSSSSSNITQDAYNPKSAQASVGEPPYYLTCSACKWDSKEIGMTFEKSTGLSLQVQRREETAVDVLEFNQLRSHFEEFLKSNSDHQGSTATTLASAARSSKLLRDVPSLANDPVFLQKRSKMPKPEKSEELKDYVATSAWDTGRDRAKWAGTDQPLDEGKALGLIGRREQDRIDFLSEQEDERDISSLVERWQSPADQSVRINDIRPCRVPLKTKQTKRCPACRHIIVKSEPKAQSSRYKIKLMALNYLPEIQIIAPAPAGSAVTAAEERRRGLTLLASRRKDAGTRIDEENLLPGRTYLFEASFSNPLDDAMTVQLHIAKRATSSSLQGQDSGQKSASSSPSKGSSSQVDWTVTPTTSAFPIGAFNEVWELDDEDNELLESVAKDSAARKKGESGQGDGIDELDDLDDVFDDDQRDDRGQRRALGSDLGGKNERRRKGDGILKRKGHETTIGLELALAKDSNGEIEFAMQVTYHYLPDAADERSKKEEGRKSFSFWTIIRLGKVSTDADRVAISGLPAMSTEARRSALDKRRSIMGINVHQSTASSTLSSLRESS